MPTTHKTSFLITPSLIFLLPVFFVPGGALNLDTGKSALLILGIAGAVLVFLLEAWQAGKFELPWHPFVLLAALLPLVYLLSALLSTPSALSLLGYNFEVGTFGYMLLSATLLILVPLVFIDTSRVLQALAAFFISVSVIAIFVAIKILSGGVPVWGVFFGNTANPIGKWTDLAMVLGLLSMVSTLVLGMIPTKQSLRSLLYGVFGLSTALLAVLNFSPAFVLTLGSAVLLFLYFLKVETHFFSTAPTLPQATASFFLKPTFLPIVLAVVSLLFLVNPTVSKTRGTLGNVVANTFKVENSDVRPSFFTTLSISKAVLSQGTLLGSGPNTFERDWLIYKPASINATPFWAVSFPFGAAFIPTQIATTGVLGTALWLVFFVFFILMGVKASSAIPESRTERFAMVSTFLIALFLWAASFLYSPSATMLLLAFIFSGLFIAVSRKSRVISFRMVDLKNSPQAYFSSVLLLTIVALGALAVGWFGFNRTVSAFHFKRAVDLSNTAGAALADIENELDQAVKFSKLDTHYLAISRINFAKAQVAVNSATGTPETNRAIFEEALRKSIEAARSAVSANPAGYQNWVLLGGIYSALVPAPLSVEGAYENARFAYSEAAKRNPANPELPLLFAQLELNKGKVDEARSLVRNAIALKDDYADAYLMLARLEIQANNIPEAIASTERLALLVPNNAGIYFELGFLKYSNKDYIGASKALTLSLSATPDYANAKYYLGLSLARLGQLDEALEQFEALSLANPDNAELRLILKDLGEGKTGFLNSPTK